eukprot:14414093-Alexandrium_andersonii.AAC.1
MRECVVRRLQLLFGSASTSCRARHAGSVRVIACHRVAIGAVVAAALPWPGVGVGSRELAA